MTRMHINRRAFVFAALASTWAVASARVGVLAQDTASPSELAEVPSTGGRRSGPIESTEGLTPAAAKKGGVAPVTIEIAKADVDAPVERIDIVDGVMQNPSGPWVVSWYEDLAALGEGSNAVMAGHVDYWDIGPAVFQNLYQLVKGDEIRVAGEDGTVFAYAVEWQRNFVVANMTPADLATIVGDTDRESLTLITCAVGTWDAEKQEYRERMVVRATQAT